MSANPCSLGKRHKWEFVRNVTSSAITFRVVGSFARISKKGLYKCACGATKHGDARVQ